MLKKLLKNIDVYRFNEGEQKAIQGKGISSWPSTEEQCMICGGEWNDPVCRLSMDSPCV